MMSRGGLNAVLYVYRKRNGRDVYCSISSVVESNTGNM